MFRLMALWAVLVAGSIFWILRREERLAAAGKVPLGRLRRLWLHSERRGAPRYRIDWPVRYQWLPPKPAGPSFAGMSAAQSRDVSATGVALVVPERLEVGSEIHLELTLPNRSNALAVSGQVMWCREGPRAQERLFFIGVHFAGLNQQTAQTLKEALGKK